MSGWYMIGRRRTKVMHISRIVVKMAIALFISERWEVESEKTTIGTKIVAGSVSKAPLPSSFVAIRWPNAQHTMVTARVSGMIAK